jgi:hypothetical protein
MHHFQPQWLGVMLLCLIWLRHVSWHLPQHCWAPWMLAVQGGLSQQIAVLVWLGDSAAQCCCTDPGFPVCMACWAAAA